uniref:Secreted protein n=1 Tax=Streptomyces auratus AGR0001 TaxID=1160718 RepID=J1S883_9ACTN
MLFFRVVFSDWFIAMLFCSCCCSDAVVFAPKVSCTCPWSDQLMVFEIENSTVCDQSMGMGSVRLTYVCLEITSGGGCAMSFRSSMSGTPTVI